MSRRPKPVPVKPAPIPFDTYMIRTGTRGYGRIAKARSNRRVFGFPPARPGQIHQARPGGYLCTRTADGRVVPVGGAA